MLLSPCRTDWRSRKPLGVCPTHSPCVNISSAPCAGAPEGVQGRGGRQKQKGTCNGRKWSCAQCQRNSRPGGEGVRLTNQVSVSAMALLLLISLAQTKTRRNGSKKYFKNRLYAKILVRGPHFLLTCASTGS